METSTTNAKERASFWKHKQLELYFMPTTEQTETHRHVKKQRGKWKEEQKETEVNKTA